MIKRERAGKQCDIIKAEDYQVWKRGRGRKSRFFFKWGWEEYQVVWNFITPCFAVNVLN